MLSFVSSNESQKSSSQTCAIACVLMQQQSVWMLNKAMSSKHFYSSTNTMSMKVISFVGKSK